MRIILHVDLDSFYAAVEENRNPDIVGKPIVICMYSGRSKDSGAVATANYPARERGIRSGLPLRIAKARASPETIFLPADREYYKQISDRVMDIMRTFAESFEQRSIDEAYLDVSHIGGYDKAVKQSKALKKTLLTKEHLTCSVGIGPNKLVAKMASREEKPDGLTVVQPQRARTFLAKKPVEKLFGIGPKTLAVLQEHDITTIRDLAKCDLDMLKREFGDRKGRLLKEHAQGKDIEPVSEVIRQQLSRLGTLPKDTRDIATTKKKLATLIADLSKHVTKIGVTFRTVTLITITTTLDMQTRSQTLEKPSRKRQDIVTIIDQLLKEYFKEHPQVRLRRIGVRVSSLTHPTQPKQQRALSDFSSSRR